MRPFSGAAAEVLGFFFPAHRDTLRARAEEAAMSRVYGGIHYRFDSEAGLAAGRAIARLAVQRAQGD
jgi:membrane-associated phospholipid phosphatase